MGILISELTVRVRLVVNVACLLGNSQMSKSRGLFSGLGCQHSFFFFFFLAVLGLHCGTSGCGAQASLVAALGLSSGMRA